MLVFVTDDGVYLMSSGQPALRRPDAALDHQVVYAYGWTPPSLRNPRLTHLGDDFAEHLHLAEPLNSDGGTLLAALRGGHAREHRYLILHVGHTAFDISISRGGPPGT